MCGVDMVVNCVHVGAKMVINGMYVYIYIHIYIYISIWLCILVFSCWISHHESKMKALERLWHDIGCVYIHTYVYIYIYILYIYMYICIYICKCVCLYLLPGHLVQRMERIFPIMHAPAFPIVIRTRAISRQKFTERRNHCSNARAYHVKWCRFARKSNLHPRSQSEFLLSLAWTCFQDEATERSYDTNEWIKNLFFFCVVLYT